MQSIKIDYYTPPQVILAILFLHSFNLIIDYPKYHSVGNGVILSYGQIIFESTLYNSEYQNHYSKIYLNEVLKKV